MQPLYYFNVKPSIEINGSIDADFAMKTKEIKEAATPFFIGSPCNNEIFQAHNGLMK